MNTENFEDTTMLLALKVGKEAVSQGHENTALGTRRAEVNRV